MCTYKYIRIYIIHKGLPANDYKVALQYSLNPLYVYKYL